MEQIFEEIKQKRENQNELGYTSEHDDNHTFTEFIYFVQIQCSKSYDYSTVDAEAFRDRFLEIAALAVAAVESIDRQLELSKAEGLDSE